MLRAVELLDRSAHIFIVREADDAFVFALSMRIRVRNFARFAENIFQILQYWILFDGKQIQADL